MQTPSALNTPTLSSSQPNGVPASRPSSSHPGSSSSLKTARQQAWEAEQSRLQGLGRELKHAATAHHTSATSGSSSNSRQQEQQLKLAAITALESLLCYIFAFAAYDEAALAAEPRLPPSVKNWQSLRGFFGFVKRHTEPFPPLVGLTCHLGAAYNARILEIYTQVPAAAASASASAARDAAILDFFTAMQSAARDAEAKLDLDLLQQLFPRAWAQRSRQPLGLAPEPPLEPGKFAGPYKLPIPVMPASPVRAARAGVALLTEWAEKEGVEYAWRLKIGGS